MKHHVVSLALALAVAGIASTQAAEPASTAAATVVGSWSVDTSRLPLPPEARPRSVTISFDAQPGDRLRMRVDVVGPTGSVLQAQGVTPLDGSPVAVPSNFEADMSATTMPRPDLLIVQLAKDGRPASTRIYAVAQDGRSMVETVAYFGADGKPFLRTNHFSRTR